MAYSLTSAASPKALLAAIVTFATAQGWTIEYDHSTGVGSSFGGQIALTSGNCHVAIGEQTASQNPIAVSGLGGSFNDGRLYAALSSSINTGSIQYWNHPGSLVTSATDTDRLTINDVWGPMDEVYFFGDSTHITCVVKCSNNRWTMFSFGQIDTKGLSSVVPAYLTTNYHEFWNTDTQGGSVHRNATIYQANAGFTLFSGGGLDNHVFIPDGIVDPSLGFVDGDIMAKGRTDSYRHGILAMFNSGSKNYPNQGTGTGVFQNSGEMDHLMFVRNQPTTGGVPLHALPIVYYDQTANQFQSLGQIPGIRACRNTNISPADEIAFGTDIYKVFPLKRKGTPEDAGFNGGIYNNQANTFDLAWAIHKVV